LGLPLYHPALSLGRGGKSAGRLEILAGLEEFREHLGGTLTITLLTNIGQSIEVSEMDERAVVAAIAWLRERGLRLCA